MSFLLKMVRTLFSFIDKAIYSLISLFYELLMYLANLDLFGMSTISTSNTSLTANNPILKFSNRIYALLGIFMLFRISFSILQYMINPDDFSDKGKGFGKLITNVLVSLVLIVTVPLIFQKAYEVQKIVLNENLLGKLILGVNDNGNNSKSTNKQMAKDLEFLVYASLMPVNENAVSECKDSPVLGTKAMAQNDECLNSLSNALGDDSGELNKVFKTDDEGSNRDFGAFGTLLNAVGDDDEFVFEYYVVLTTFAGGFIAVMMVSFCLDVAVRIIKLAFLEIIAPIPVISYMDPSQSSKDGMLSKWAKECFSTFLSLFIRIAIIYFAFYLIDLVVSTCLVSNGTAVYLNEDAPTGLMAILVQVSVIFGILYFTKEFPKLLESIFGLKASGTLNFERINKIKGAALGGAMGFGMGVAGAATGAGVFSPVTDTLSGITGGYSGQKISELNKKISTRNIDMRNAISNGSTLRGRMAARISAVTGTQGALGKLEDKKRILENDVHQAEAKVAPVKKRMDARNEIKSKMEAARSRATEEAKKSSYYVDRMNQVQEMRIRSNNATDIKSRTNLIRRANDMENEINSWAKSDGADKWIKQNGNTDLEYRRSMQAAAIANSKLNKDEQIGNVYDVAASYSSYKNESNNLSSANMVDENSILAEQNIIDNSKSELEQIDTEHRKEESNYMVTGTKSGGTRVKNITPDPRAGEHPGGHHDGGPFGPMPGGHMH